MNLQTLLAKLEAAEPQKKDFTLPAKDIDFCQRGESVDMLLRLPCTDDPTVHDTIDLPNITDGCHQQIAEKLDIPIIYYRKMLSEAPHLFIDSVRTWLEKFNDKKFFVRTYSNGSQIARAFLSDNYRVIDNRDVLLSCLEELQNKETKIEEAELTETMMFVKVKSEQLRDFIRERNDELIGGILIQNSETGHAAVRIQPRIFRVQCTNGAILEQFSTRQIHLGSNGDELQDDIIYLNIRRAIRETFDRFGEIVNLVRDSAVIGLPDIKVAVNNVVKQYRLTESQRENILMAYAVEPMETKWGLVNAITRAAKQEENFERTIEMERLGGRIIQLDENKYSRLVKSEVN